MTDIGEKRRTINLIYLSKLRDRKSCECRLRDVFRKRNIGGGGNVRAGNGEQGGVPVDIQHAGSPLSTPSGTDAKIISSSVPFMKTYSIS